jgi:hypothetical protein
MYKGKKQFKVEHSPTWAEIEVEIDFDVELEDTTVYESIRAQVEFWTDWEFDIMADENDYVKAYLKNLLRACIVILTERDFNLNGLIGAFKNKEGWATMDGSMGIKLLSSSDPNFDDLDDYEITEKEVKDA